MSCAYASKPDATRDTECGITGDPCISLAGGDQCPMLDESEGRGNAIDLTNIPTCKLVEELGKREGVDSYNIPFERGYTLEIDCDGYYVGDGPAIILTVID